MRRGRRAINHSLKSINLVQLSCQVRIRLLLLFLLIFAACVLRIASFVLGWRMGGRKLSKFVNWENGTRAVCNNCVNRAGNVH